nr:unnamed protein product [Digitaria exilis]
MPELPEVEAARRALQAHCGAAGLQLDAPPFPSFQFAIVLVLQLLLVRSCLILRKAGSVVNSEEEWPSKYSKFFAELDDGLEFSFTDKRRFARVRLFEDPETVPPISELGPDALFAPMSVESFLDSLGRKKIGIKALLLDQSFISGIGNWIADEVLYQSRIHPLQIASNLSRENCEALHRSIHEVCLT